MADIDAIKAQTDAVAAEPQSVTTDGQSASEYPLADRLEYEAARAEDAAESAGGTKSGWGRVRMARAVPPGATGVNRLE